LFCLLNTVVGNTPGICRENNPSDKIKHPTFVNVKIEYQNISNKNHMQKITPFLWFDNNAEEAINFYTSIFKDSKIVNVSRYGEGGPGPKGTVMSATFLLNGQEFMALNGGPHFKFTEAISLFIKCETQPEIDEMWEKLSEGGQKSRCGWLKDKFGLSWQVVPPILGQFLSDKDPEKSKRVMMAMMKMDKIDIKTLQQAYDNK
jgi:predicted 3-demethylubiquinone-9 3-methyltransferase (glyoxalase superfamily)